MKNLTSANGISPNLQIEHRLSDTDIGSWSTGDGSTWVQLAGHPGSLIPTGTGSVLKTYNAYEAACLKALQTDVLSVYIPSYEGTQLLNGKLYVRMQDLLFGMHSPSVMDCKMGQRTYLEDEVEVVRDSQPENLRVDMYHKMIAVDVNAPTSEEHQQKAVTKLRYMRWRESLSTTAKMGFRVEAVKKFGFPVSRDFKLVSTREHVKAVLSDFLRFDLTTCNKYLRKLESLRTALEKSEFFARHEFIGSSLLFAHDTPANAVNVWMIDFGKTLPVSGSPLNHRTSWCFGNHEDGYLYGMDNLIDIFTEIHQHLSTTTGVCPNLVHDSYNGCPYSNDSDVNFDTKLF